MSMAEMFLMAWAGVATAFAVFHRSMYYRIRLHFEKTNNLLCEIACGEVKAKFDGEFWTVENEDIRVKFKRKGENHGV